jgi:hypothetical protein
MYASICADGRRPHGASAAERRPSSGRYVIKKMETFLLLKSSLRIFRAPHRENPPPHAQTARITIPASGVRAVAAVAAGRLAGRRVAPKDHDSPIRPYGMPVLVSSPSKRKAARAGLPHRSAQARRTRCGLPRCFRTAGKTCSSRGANPFSDDPCRWPGLARGGFHQWLRSTPPDEASGAGRSRSRTPP